MSKNKKSAWIAIIAGLLVLLAGVVWFKNSHSQPTDIPFDYVVESGGGLTIHKVWAQNTGTNVEFHIDYTSDVDRGLSFFDPPVGKHLSIQKNFPAGTGSVLVVASSSALQKISNLTVNFYIPDKEITGHLFFDFQKIMDILP